MKNLLTSLLLLLTLSSFAQFGINAGVNSSWFGGPGDQTYTGLKHHSEGLKAGIYNKMEFYRSPFFIQPELNYIHLGGRNPKEDHRNYSNYNVQLQLSAGINFLKYCSFEIGGYHNWMVYARNNVWYGPTFGWSVRKWGDYMNTSTSGLQTAFSFDFIGMIGKVTYLHGLSNVRASNHGIPGYNDPKMFHNQDRCLMIGGYFPFKPKKYK